jgi:hypothetical protein
MVFVPTEHYGELIREMRRLGVAPDMLVEILREVWVPKGRAAPWSSSRRSTTAS